MSDRQGLLFDEPAPPPAEKPKRPPWCWIVSMLKTHPGWTIGELHRHHAYLPGSYKPYEYVEKLARLEAEGVVRRGATRVCRASGAEASTWFLT